MRRRKTFAIFLVLFLALDLGLLAFIACSVAEGRQMQKEVSQLEEELEALQVKKNATYVGSETEENQEDFRENIAQETEQTNSESEIQITESMPESEETLELEEEDDFYAMVGSLQENYLVDAENAGQAWAVSIENLVDGRQTDYHGDIAFQSASVIKVFIMAAIYDKVCYPKEGTEAIYFSESYEGELKDLLTSMITVSDNDAANRLVEGLGNGNFENGASLVNSFCRESGYENTSLGRRFLAQNPSEDNYVSANDCRKLLADIYRGQCVCSEASAKMLELLKGQTRTEKIPAGLPAGTASANKTGEMPEGYGLGCIENDIAIIFGEKGDYVLCILSNNLGGNNEDAKEKIRGMSGEVYENMQKTMG